MSAAATRSAHPRPPQNLARHPDQRGVNETAPQVSGALQLVIALYILLTSDLPLVVQALAFGAPGGAGTELALAMLTSLLADAMLIGMLLFLGNNALGLLHPLILALIIWPLVTRVPATIETLGGWAGVVVGSPLEAPIFTGLRSNDPALIWTAVAKYNSVQLLGLVCTFIGYWFIRPTSHSVRRIRSAWNSRDVRSAMIVVFGVSLFVLLAFIWTRGGLMSHLTALGNGRFRELEGSGPILAFTDIGAIALYIWIAARPGDIKSPLFLAFLAAATFMQFVSEGSRGSALIVPIFVGVIWSLRRQKIPWKVALLLVPVMFASIGLLLAVRSASWGGNTAAEAWQNTSWTQSIAIAQDELSQRRVVSASVPVVARGMEVTGGPLLGFTYVAAFTTFVPRALWENKPRGAGSIYAQRFLGASREGLGIPLNQEAELYWNFGLPGVIFFLTLFGVVLRLAGQYFWRRYPDPFAIVFLAIFTRTFEFSSKGIVDIQHQIVLILMCYLLVAMLSPKVSYQRAAQPLRQRPAASRPV